MLWTKKTNFKNFSKPLSFSLYRPLEIDKWYFAYVTNDHRYIPFVIITILPYPHLWPIDVYKSNMSGATSGAGTDYPSGTSEFYFE
jgi:hypothetical protein